MAVNPETLGNFSNPVVPKAPKAPRISMSDLNQASQATSDAYKAEGEAAVQKSMGEAQATRDAAYQTSDIQRAAREPILKELSTVSKGVDFKPTQETFIGMSSLAGLIAFIGTASGKYGASSGRGAIDAMTGMMKGYQTGRQDIFRREQIQFEKEMASLKATQERLYKELELADKTALIDSAKASADRAVAIAASGSDFLKASYNTKGAIGVKEDLYKFMDAQLKADKMAQDLGLAMMKVNAKDAGKPLKDKEINSITGLESLANGLMNLKNKFKPEYASLGLFGFGADLQAEALRRFGDEEGRKAISWWSDYQRLQAPNRHALFGATLTGNELKNYQEFTAKKSDQPKVVQNMIQDQIDYTLDTAGQRRRAFESSGYRLPDAEPVSFTATYGNAPTGGGTQDKYVTGKVYTDSSGNKAKYLGNGNWEDQ
tara:strand:- start:5214 stop:6503 length:1290 start_codon:yes stop_codon:yes gene_type:complete